MFGSYNFHTYKCFQLLLFLAIGSYGYAQVTVFPEENVGIGADQQVAPSAKLEINSDSQGFLMPRLTWEIMNSIQNPADGLQVFVNSTDTDQRGIWYYDGLQQQWVRLATSLTGGGNSGGQNPISTINSPNVELDLTDDILSSDLTQTGVLPGSYNSANISVDEFGRITAATNGGNAGTSTFNTEKANGISSALIPELPDEAELGQVAITPTVESAKILVIAKAIVRRQGGGDDFRRVRVRVRRNGTTAVGRQHLIDGFEDRNGFRQGEAVIAYIDDVPQNLGTNEIIYSIEAGSNNTDNLLRGGNWDIIAIELTIPQGPEGPIGPQGPQGNTGPQGPSGSAGIDGVGGATIAGSNIEITGQGTTSSPYIVSNTFNEVDGDITNEIQSLSTNGTPGQIDLSNGGGSVIINIEDDDADATNELQLLSSDGVNLTISNGNTIPLSMGPAGNGIVTTTDNGNGTFTLFFTDGSSFTTSDLTGPAGAQGSTGATGQDGSQGATGAQGPEGPAGNGIMSTVDNGDGTFTIAFTDGSSFTTSDLTGPAGTQGSTGATGQDGSPGATGAQGPEGPAGNGIMSTVDNGDGTFTIVFTDGGSFTTPDLTGPTGLQGAIGATGAEGPQGPIGATGAEGPQGPIGATGAEGPQGQMGLQGPIGATGAEGPQGPQGPIGLQGDQGPAGLDAEIDDFFLQDTTIVLISGQDSFEIKLNTCTIDTYLDEVGTTIDSLFFLNNFGDTLIAIPTTQGPEGPAGNGISSTVDNGDGTFTLMFTDGGSFTTSDLTGPTGAQGATGATGPEGPQGPQGPMGLQGAQGPAGMGAEIDDFFLQDTTIVLISGQDSFEIKLNTCTIDTYLDEVGTTIDSLFFLNNFGDTLASISTIQGPAGNGISSTVDNGDGTFTLMFTDGGSFTTSDLTGPTGAQGATGATGAEGPQGLTGATGATGAEGPQGQMGLQGPIGATGAEGPQGPMGLQGLQGDQGPAGMGAEIDDFFLQDTTIVLISELDTFEIKLNTCTIDTYLDEVGSTIDSLFFLNNFGDTLAAISTIQGPAGNGISSTVDNGDGTFTLMFTDGGSFTTSDLTGPTGAQGPIGIQGATGATGAEGPQGPMGLQGLQGDQGPAGMGAEIDDFFLQDTTIVLISGQDSFEIKLNTCTIDTYLDEIGSTIDSLFFLNNFGDTLAAISTIQGPAGNGISSTVDNGDGTFTLMFTDGGSFTTSDLTGLQGPIGLQGPQGDQGPAGNGIASITDNGDGTFTIFYTDGGNFVTSDFTGPVGPTGMGSSIDTFYLEDTTVVLISGQDSFEINLKSCMIDSYLDVIESSNDSLYYISNLGDTLVVVGTWDCLPTTNVQVCQRVTTSTQVVDVVGLFGTTQTVDSIAVELMPDTDYILDSVSFNYSRPPGIVIFAELYKGDPINGFLISTSDSLGTSASNTSSTWFAFGNNPVVKQGVPYSVVLKGDNGDIIDVLIRNVTSNDHRFRIYNFKTGRAQDEEAQSSIAWRPITSFEENISKATNSNGDIKYYDSNNNEISFSENIVTDNGMLVASFRGSYIDPLAVDFVPFPLTGDNMIICYTDNPPPNSTGALYRNGAPQAIGNAGYYSTLEALQVGEPSPSGLQWALVGPSYIPHVYSSGSWIPGIGQVGVGFDPSAIDDFFYYLLRDDIPPCDEYVYTGSSWILTSISVNDRIENGETIISVPDGSIDFQVNGISAGTITENAGDIKWTLDGVVEPIAYLGSPANHADVPDFSIYRSEADDFYWQKRGADSISMFGLAGSDQTQNDLVRNYNLGENTLDFRNIRFEPEVTATGNGGPRTLHNIQFDLPSSGSTSWVEDDPLGKINWRTFDNSGIGERDVASIQIVHSRWDDGINPGIGNITVATEMQFFTADWNDNMFQRMVIDRVGNVGIGTPDPDSKLHINGNARVDGGVLSDYYRGNQTDLTSVPNNAIYLGSDNFYWQRVNATDSIAMFGLGASDQSQLDPLRIYNLNLNEELRIEEVGFLTEEMRAGRPDIVAGVVRIQAFQPNGIDFWNGGDLMGALDFYSRDNSRDGAQNYGSIRLLNDANNGNNAVAPGGNMVIYTKEYDSGIAMQPRIDITGSGSIRIGAGIASEPSNIMFRRPSDGEINGRFDEIGTGQFRISSTMANEKLLLQANNAPVNIAQNDLEIEQIGSGIIMKSPDGSCWRVTIDNSGGFVSTSITCP